MSKKIVIVESDTAFAQKLEHELTKNGFQVVQTADGKGAYDLCRREMPTLVVLAVELAAGQSGYLVCGKIKKDDELKRVPVVIIGKDAEGFEGHKKLKTRAEEYLKKPFAPEALTVKVGVLIGLPEDGAAAEELVVEDEAIALVETASEGTLNGDPDLDMLDDAFANLTPGGATAETPADIAPEEPSAPADLSLAGADEDFALDKLGGEEPAPLDIELHEEVSAPPPPPARPSSSSGARPPRPAPAIDDAELHHLRDQVHELEDKLTQLESSVAEKDAELAAAKASSGGGKDTSALKEAALKKDKEILRLKQELNEKETELVDLREKEAAYEEQTNASAGELAKRDTQIKSLTQKVDQLTGDKRKADAAVNAAKDEARAATSSLSGVQSELDSANEQLSSLRGQLEALETQAAELRREAEQARTSAASELESLRSELDSARNELASLRSDRAGMEEEASQLRGRVAELETANSKNEDRVVKAYQKIKGDEKLREKTKKAISVALQLLDDSAGANVIADETDLNA